MISCGICGNQLGDMCPQCRRNRQLEALTKEQRLERLAEYARDMFGLEVIDDAFDSTVEGLKTAIADCVTCGDIPPFEAP